MEEIFLSPDKNFYSVIKLRVESLFETSINNFSISEENEVLYFDTKVDLLKNLEAYFKKEHDENLKESDSAEWDFEYRIISSDYNVEVLTRLFKEDSGFGDIYYGFNIIADRGKIIAIS